MKTVNVFIRLRDLIREDGSEDHRRRLIFEALKPRTL